MRTRWILTMVLLAALNADAQTKPSTTLLQDWKDTQRDVVVPVKIYLPAELNEPAPIVIVSHGLGGSRDGLGYLGSYWSAHGYITVHPTHRGSDTEVLRNRGEKNLQQAAQGAATMEQSIKRTQDVKFVIDELERLNNDAKSPLGGKLKLDAIAMAGHSFGAVTTQAICGQSFAIKPTSRGDKRVKCGVALSPSAPRGGDPKRAFADVAVPMIHLTGTDDDAVMVGDTKATDRRVPFDMITGSDQYLAIFTGADHMLLGGGARRGPRGNPNAAAQLRLIEKTSTAFLDAYLKGDEQAKAWLKNDARDAIGKLGTWEVKTK